MSSHSLSNQSLGKGDDKPETDRDPLPHYYNPMANPDTSFFYTSREGRFVFPFQESAQKELVSLDDDVETTLPPIAEKADAIARRVWREVFTALRIGFIFIFVFVIELVRFVAHDVVHGFIVRLLAILGDFIIKPLLVTLFNSYILPITIFVWNTLAAVSNMVQPAVGIINSLAIQAALILKAFRLVEINKAPMTPTPIQDV